MSTTLLVANDGGHIVQLRTLLPRFDAIDRRVWATPPTPQTESMLAGEVVHWVDEGPTRNWRAMVRNAVKIRRLLQATDVSRAISTGSSLALSTLPQAALKGIEAHYIESVTRTGGYSLTGRILAHTPGISLYAQWPHLATGRWKYVGSVLDGFEAVTVPAADVHRVVVSVGTSGRYGFPRLVKRLRNIIPPSVEVLWQTGSTDVTGLDIDARPRVPATELTAAIEAADVIVAHAGAGICLTALRSGKIPLLAPRLASKGEHVDDHQTQIATFVGRLGLAVVEDASSINWTQLTEMTRRKSLAAASLPPFQLHPASGHQTRATR